MCQLLGISANEPVDMMFSFREWKHRGNSRNPHGYGFAYWDSDGPRIIKAASDLYSEALKVKDQIASVRSRTYLCHVRLGSVGSQDGTNTHPFVARVGNRQFVFAHNGTVRDIKRRSLWRLRPTGDTDSEYAFLWMLEELDGVGETNFASRLKELADDIHKLGRFNFLLSDGTTLWAYADDSLHYIERTPPYGGELVRLQDDGYTISMAEVKRPSECAVLAATEPLTDEDGWQRMARKKLIVMSLGRFVQRH